MGDYRINITTGIGYAKDGVVLGKDTVINGLDNVRSYLTREVGGYTEIPTRGGWLDGDREVSEDGRRFEVIGDEAEAERLAAYVAEQLQQQLVMVEVEPLTRAAFVGPR